nr:hypothetical protein GCM10023233_05750 [Brevibacterium otitidis]
MRRGLHSGSDPRARCWLTRGITQAMSTTVMLAVSIQMMTLLPSCERPGRGALCPLGWWETAAGPTREDP